MFKSLEKVRIDVIEKYHPNKKICANLKLITILFDLILHNMLNCEEVLTT